MGRYVYAGYQNVKTGSAKRVMFRVPPGTGSCSYTTNWTVPANVTCATFEIWGGGGSGAPNCCCNCSMGNAGSAGGYSLKTIPVTPGDVYSITVGAGGCGSECWYQSNACGCSGGITYVTGNNLSNFCATGGGAGYWCNAGLETSVAGVGYGGDVNIRGRQSRAGGCCQQGCGGSRLGGAAPFGGGWQIASGTVGNCTMTHSCAPGGIFPGGGGLPKPSWQAGWCDCCASGCSGPGADGLVIITL